MPFALTFLPAGYHHGVHQAEDGATMLGLDEEAPNGIKEEGSVVSGMVLNTDSLSEAPAAFGDCFP